MIPTILKCWMAVVAIAGISFIYSKLSGFSFGSLMHCWEVCLLVGLTWEIAAIRKKLDSK